MSRVRRRDTKPELELRRQLHAGGLRYRVDVPVLPDRRRRADIVFGPSRVAVYVDGCFWHACPIHGNVPKNNRAWWQAKLAANRARDLETTRDLEDRGWKVIRVWEHEDMSRAALMIARAVHQRRQNRDA